ncbi:MAG: T9SS type A sorting domain-containing protein [Ignavibacterium sp.]|nr:T9SS type A sorting domain-containing protein [Ignavibacterium sp.]
MKNQFTILAFFVLCSTVLFAQSDPLPFGRTTLFAGSGICEVCHASDGGNVMTVNGLDVSPVTYWRSTMMGNASKDPFWRAVVAEEVHRFPTLQQTIETTCINCHSPMGYTEAFFNGATNYSMAQMKADPIANDGVSCTVCHQIKPDNFGSALSYSGHYEINLDSIIYGPYEDPLVEQMYDMSFFTPVYTNHLNQSELCATCHTLFTPYLDNQGQIAGKFPEQTPYIEWKNSIYPAQNTQCQDCHMPMITDSVDIASIPQSHQVFRSPFWKHVFVGGNVYMLRMLKDNIQTLGLTASAENFDSTIARAEENLTKKAIELYITTTYQNDSLNVFVKIENKAGHKIPSGIPFRRMWIHLKVTDPKNNVVYESGNYDELGEITGLDADYEPHYDLITNENEIQIYEGVMVDVDLAVTNTLLRASQYIKDNRIPPKGFTTTHPSYDTTAIFGSAASDPNFNRENTTQGTGSDIVNYRFPVTNETAYKVFAEVCFQTIKPRVVSQLAAISEPDIIQFVGMYNNLPNTPFILKSDSINVFVSDVADDGSTVKGFSLSQNYPNPFNPSTKINYQIQLASKVTLKIFDVLGNEVAILVDGYKSVGRYEVEFNVAQFAAANSPAVLPSGVYFYKLEATPNNGGNAFREVRKMILLK